MATLSLAGTLSGIFGASSITGAHGEQITLGILTELTTVESGVQAQETTLTIPASSIVLAASVRVLVQPGATTAMSVRGAVGDHQFNLDEVGTDPGATDPGVTGCPFVTGSAEPLRYVFDTPTSDALGQIRCAIFYYAITPPSS